MIKLLSVSFTVLVFLFASNVFAQSSLSHPVFSASDSDIYLLKFTTRMVGKQCPDESIDIGSVETIKLAFTHYQSAGDSVTANVRFLYYSVSPIPADSKYPELVDSTGSEFMELGNRRVVAAFNHAGKFRSINLIGDPVNDSSPQSEIDKYVNAVQRLQRIQMQLTTTFYQFSDIAKHSVGDRWREVIHDTNNLEVGALLMTSAYAQVQIIEDKDTLGHLIRNIQYTIDSTVIDGSNIPEMDDYLKQIKETSNRDGESKETVSGALFVDKTSGKLVYASRSSVGRITVECPQVEEAKPMEKEKKRRTKKTSSQPVKKVTLSSTIITEVHLLK